MTQETAHETGPENSETLPGCCKDAAEKMAGCGPMMEKMMAHCGPIMKKMMAGFTAETNPDAPCAKVGERCGAG
jgi:hypothetical protein